MGVVCIGKHSSHLFIGAFIIPFVVPLIGMPTERIAGAIYRTLGTGSSRNAD